MGVVFNKFTGSRGKSGSNDANAEYMGFIRRVMESNNVTYQTAELGKVDLRRWWYHCVYHGIIW